MSAQVALYARDSLTTLPFTLERRVKLPAVTACLDFGFTKGDILQALSSLFSATELTLESERALEVALQLLRESTADFADCLHIALATQAGEQPLWTFDQGAATVRGARLMSKA